MSLGDGASGGGDREYGGVGQTRTRLPDRGGDVYGGARRSRSSSRGLVTVVGVVVLLIAAIALANRGGGDSPSDGAHGKRTAAPTAASGTHPVQSKTNDIPSGFAHDEQGAQSAAANYAVALGSDGMFKTESRHTIVDTIYTPAAADKLQGPMDQAYSTSFLSKLGLDANGDAPEGSVFVSRTIPVGGKVTRYSTDAAEVSIWYMGLIGMSGQKSTDPVSSTWKTWNFELQWSNGDWKVVTDSQTNGPAAVPGDDTASTSDEISKAIKEYGGFTYAR